MQKYVFDSGKPGPRLLFFGGVHGDEPSGSEAIEHVASELARGSLALSRGSVTMVAHCNEKARALGVRKVEKNLNRCFVDGAADDTYEHGVARELMPLMRAADVLVDLHSTSGKSEPFAFAEGHGLPLAVALRFSKVVVGWSEMAQSYGAMEGDSESYMRSLGKPAVTFEAGDHGSPDGAANARQAILNAFASYGVAPVPSLPIGRGPQRFVRMESSYVLKTPSWGYSLSPVVNFAEILAGTEIGRDGGERVLADRDCVLIMPSVKSITPGTQVYYLGRGFTPPDSSTAALWV